MNYLIGIILFIFSISCSTVEYKSNNLISVDVSRHVTRTTPFEISGVSKFYLWGLLPQKGLVNLDYEIQQIGFISAANITLEEYQSSLNLFLTIISLGMYVPLNYKIRGHGERYKSVNF